MNDYGKFSQHQKILMVMCRSNSKDWFFPYDFMADDLGDLFVGYEASARLSELAADYPEMIDSLRDGKYIKRRLRMETMEHWLPSLPKDLRYIFHRAGMTAEYKKSRQLTNGVAPGQIQMEDMPPAIKKRIML